MENSGNILFENDAPQWYIAYGERWVGPLSASDIYEKILAQKLTWAHYVWKKGQSEWKRICDVKTFQAAVPHQPPKTVQKKIQDSVKPAVKPSSKKRELKASPPPAPFPEVFEVRSWYLYYNESQFGPFSQEEIRRFIKIGKIHARVHAWQEGMGNWQRLEEIQAFQEELSGIPPRRPSSSKSSPPAVKHEEEERVVEQRSHPRRPLVAKILLSDEHSVLVGVCRDISIGGMQVLTERIPGKVGARLKMNVSPSSQGSAVTMDPFVAEGVIVRILEDGRGFSFRFQRLPERAKQAIESYIDSPL